MHRSLELTGFPRPGARWVVAAFIVGAAALAADVGLPWPLAWLILGAPLVEEVIFRLGLQESLLRRLPARHAWAANLLTALAFAGAHLLVRPGWLAAATLLPALAIGWTYGRQRRLAPCVLWHALFNLAGAAVLGLPFTP
jgi:membrane protease YdiL (CAAX protease family)